MRTQLGSLLFPPSPTLALMMGGRGADGWQGQGTLLCKCIILRARARARHRATSADGMYMHNDGPIQYDTITPSSARQYAMINIGQTLKLRSGNSSLILLAVLACLPACLPVCPGSGDRYPFPSLVRGQVGSYVA